MLSEFDPQRIETKKKSYKKHYKTLIDVSEKRETLFLLCLKALDCVISKDFGSVEVPKSKPCNDFLRSVETEMDIEERAGAQYSKGMPCQL